MISKILTNLQSSLKMPEITFSSSVGMSSNSPLLNPSKSWNHINFPDFFTDHFIPSFLLFTSYFNSKLSQYYSFVWSWFCLLVKKRYISFFKRYKILTQFTIYLSSRQGLPIWTSKLADRRALGKSKFLHSNNNLFRSFGKLLKCDLAYLVFRNRKSSASRRENLGPRYDKKYLVFGEKMEESRY